MNDPLSTRSFDALPGAPAPAVAAPAVQPIQERNAYGAAEGEAFGVRRYDVARNSRLTQSHWVHATGESINHDLAADIESLQAQASYEYSRNAYFRGVVRTYALHVVGPRGPRLQVRSTNKQFNRKVERAWRQVFRMPDPAGLMTGVDSLKATVKHLLLAGRSLNTFAMTRRPGPVKFGWQTIHPRRLQNPRGMASDPWVLGGVRYRPSDGAPVEYYFDRPRGVVGGTGATRYQTQPKPADMVQDIFFIEEGEQVIGEPQLASALGPAAELRDYDKNVMAAASLAAKQTVFLEATHPEAVLDLDPLPESATVHAGAMNAAPIGWGVKTPTPQHPMAQYTAFHHEKLAELGRAIHMPLMLVLLSSRESNFSSAQYDGEIYSDGVAETQALIDNKSLDGALEQVVTELVLAGETGRPDEYEFIWSWPKPPHANREKLVKALRTALEDGGISLVEYCQDLGLDYEQVLEQRARVAEDLMNHGLPTTPSNLGDRRDDKDDPDTQDPGPPEGKAPEPAPQTAGATT